jgi:hypothetical protein
MFKKLFVLVIFLFLPAFTLATSGACSYHDGVNCSAGANYNGKVICNDGWTNSSVYFSDADECSYNSCSAFLVSSLPLTCREEYSYQSMLERVNKKRIDCSFRKARGELISTDCNTIDQTELDACRSGIDLVKTFNDSYEKCLNEVSIQRNNQFEREEINKDPDKIVLFNEGFDAYINLKMGKKCKESYGSIGYWDSKTQNCIIPETKQPEAIIPVDNLVKETIVNPEPTQQSDKPVQSPPKAETKVIQPIIKPSPSEQKVVAVASSVQEDSKPLINQQKTNSGSSFLAKLWGFLKNIFTFNK